MKHYIVYLFLFLSVTAIAQEQPLVFHHITTNEGLSNSNVKTILKDRLGFLWIGTENGLNRYDGYEFKVYTSGKDAAYDLETNDIFNIQEDYRGGIWITTESGYMLYQREKDFFQPDVISELKSLGINTSGNFDIHIDTNGDLWLVDSNHIYYYNFAEKRLSSFTHDIDKESTQIADFTDDGTHLVILLTTGKIWQIDKRTGKKTFSQLPDYITKQFYLRSGTIYMDSNHALWAFTGKNDQLYYQAEPFSDWENIPLKSEFETSTNVINNILDDGNGKIWIGTDHKGLFVYDREKKTCANYLHSAQQDNSIASNYVSCIYKDDNGVVWLGHNKKGISYFHESFRSFKNVTHPECKDINIIIQDKAGAIWMGTDGNGVYRKKDINSDLLEKIPVPNTAVVTIMEDHLHRIWIGTYLNGIYCYHNGKVINYTMSNCNLSSDNIWKLIEDKNNTIWVGTLGGGLQYLPEGEKEFTSVGTEIENLNFVLDMFYTGQNDLYIGTDDGLFSINVDTRKISEHKGNLKGDQTFRDSFVTNLFLDDNQLVWLGRHNGLAIWDKKKDTIYYLDKSNGLSDNIIHGFAEDKYGKVWVTSSNGLSVVSVERASNGALDFSVSSFNTEDGLKDNFFNNNAICKLNNNAIMMGGTEGYTVAYPDLIAEMDDVPSQVMFTGLSIGNQQVRVGKKYRNKIILNKSLEFSDAIELSYNDKVISFKFFAGDLLRHNKITYWYRVQGFNDQWLATKNNEIVFSSLAPGSYVLEIKACTANGTCTSGVRRLTINVTPPFYASVWAICLYVLAIVGFILLILFRARRHHRRRLQEQKIRLEREQEKQLNEMKIRFFTNVSHDLRTPLTLIITPLQRILEGDLEDKLKKKLQTIYKNSEQLLQLINSILDFRKLDVNAEKLNLKLGDMVSFAKELCNPFEEYAVERNITFNVSSEEPSLYMYFDSEKVHKMLSNIISNAFKYTPDGGMVEVHMYLENGYACMSISDTGYGISDADKEHIFERFYQAAHKKGYVGEGIGLHIVHEYVRLHGGNILVKDNKPAGTVFVLSLPVHAETTGDVEEMFEPTKVTDSTMENTNSKQSVLIVDDNTDFCEFLADSLSDDFSVFTAHNGRQALDVLRRKSVDIVVSDVMMPLMTGTELCREMKTNINWSHIPIILLTAKTDEGSKMENLEIGADDYLTKPFNFNLLKLRIDKFLEWTHNSHLSFSQKIDIAPGEITITSLDEKLIEKAISITESNINNIDFSVEELSEHLGLSRSHLYKKLMSVTGKSPSEFIRTVRLKRGKQLLEKSQLQISEIAYEVGFNSPKRFTANFKSEFGVSPSEYLKSLKDNS